MIRKITILLPFVFAVFIMLNNGFGFTNSLQPPASRTGAPGETNCAGSGCHVGAPMLNSPLLEIDFNNGSAFYEADVTYDIALNVNQTGARYGFEMVALDAANNSVGQFAATGANTAINPNMPNGRSYINHLNAPTSRNFTFQWTAPAAEVGAVTFYAAGNAANGNGNPMGDMIFTNSLTVDMNTGINDAERMKFSHYPNPVSDRLNVQYELQQTQNVRISLHNLSGKEVAVLQNRRLNAGTQTHVFELENNSLSTGLYLLKMEGETFRINRKLLVK